ncbi:MAG: PAS domain-containing protein, partial [Sphingomonas sp.]|nr:PAS domain-containing protein [Sphingomonas sp.]
MHSLMRFFELCPDLLVVANVRNGLFVRVNPAACRILGWSEDELLQRPFLDVVHPDDRAYVV